MVNIRIISHRNQRYTYNNKYQSETSQKNSQCYFVRSLLASSAFYQSNHLVKKALTRLLRHQYLDFIRKNFCTTSYGTLVTTGLTDNRSRFTGNGTFVNGGQTFHNLTVGRNRISCFTNKIVTFLQTWTANGMDFTVNQHFSRSLFTGFTQTVSLGLTTSFSDGFSKISKQ